MKSGAAHAFTVVSNPEFLREGTAVGDFFSPDRIVIGCDDPDDATLLCSLYAPLDAPTLITSVRSAEMIKYASNAFLALKISFANEVAAMCAATGADSGAVLAGVGADARIGDAHLTPGLGFGGSCLPKDVAALIRLSIDTAAEPHLLEAILEVNAHKSELRGFKIVSAPEALRQSRSRLTRRS